MERPEKGALGERHKRGVTQARILMWKYESGSIVQTQGGACCSVVAEEGISKCDLNGFLS